MMMGDSMCIEEYDDDTIDSSRTGLSPITSPRRRLMNNPNLDDAQAEQYQKNKRNSNKVKLTNDNG